MPIQFSVVQLKVSLLFTQGHNCVSKVETFVTCTIKYNIDILDNISAISFKLYAGRLIHHIYYAHARFNYCAIDAVDWAISLQ